MSDDTGAVGGDAHQVEGGDAQKPEGGTEAPVLADLQSSSEAGPRTANDDEPPKSPRAAPGYPLAFRHLSPRGKWLRAVTTLALVVHVGAMLLGGAIAPVRKFFSPVVGFYAEGLRMSNSWGMFGKPPGSTNVWVQAVLGDGSTQTLATTDAHGRTTWERIRDVRVRKILGKLAEEGDRARLGPPFTDYFCEQAKAAFGEVREVRVLNVLHETRDDDGNVTRTASVPIVYARPCLTVKGAPPRQPVPPRPDGPGAGDL